MKKIFAVICSIVMIMLMTSCTATTEGNNVRTDFFYNPDSFIEYDSSSMVSNPIPESDQIELNDTQKKICEETITLIREKHPSITTEFKIKAVKESYFQRMPSFYTYAFYNEASKTVFVREDFSEKDVSYFCHEVFHYLSDNGNGKIGFEHKYEYNGQVYILGTQINEGLANYFSTQICKHPSDTCIYELETHLVALLATAYGEDKLFEAFTTGDYSSLREDFNSKLDNIYPKNGVNFKDATIFDTFLSTLEIYKVILNADSQFYQDGKADEWLEAFAALSNSLEETAYNYCVISGKKTEARNIIRVFLKTETLHIKDVAQFNQIIN